MLPGREAPARAPRARRPAPARRARTARPRARRCAARAAQHPVRRTTPGSIGVLCRERGVTPRTRPCTARHARDAEHRAARRARRARGQRRRPPAHAALAALAAHAAHAAHATPRSPHDTRIDRGVVPRTRCDAENTVCTARGMRSRRGTAQSGVGAAHAASAAFRAPCSCSSKPRSPHNTRIHRGAVPRTGCATADRSYAAGTARHPRARRRQHARHAAALSGPRHAPGPAAAARRAVRRPRSTARPSAHRAWPGARPPGASRR